MNCDLSSKTPLSAPNSTPTDIVVVDGTQTVTCVHQEHINVSHGAVHRKKGGMSDYNLDMCAKHGGWPHGFASHTQWKTIRNSAGKIVVVNRHTGALM